MGINISIVVGQDKASSSVNASGSIQHIITDEERTTFKLGDKQLKEAVNAYFGKLPNDAYLHSPTPWGGLYKKYSWPQVQTVLVVQNAEILGITSEPVIVKTQEFVNNSPYRGAFNVGISETLNNTTSTNWSVAGTLSVGQKISYGIKFLDSSVEGEASMSYNQSWGIGGQESQSIIVGSTSGVSLELDSGEAILAELSASRRVMKVRITYNAYLIGSTAVNYNPKYKDHHFWSLGIDRVMSSGHIINSIRSTEDIEVGYYSNSKIELKEKESGKMKASHMMVDTMAI